jgi:hypothetical protein
VVSVLESEPEALTINSKPSIAEATVIVTPRLWNCNSLTSGVIGDSRGV